MVIVYSGSCIYGFLFCLLHSVCNVYFRSLDAEKVMQLHVSFCDLHSAVVYP